MTPTSRSVLPASFRPKVEVVAESTRVMVEQLRAIDVGRLGDFAGRLSPAEMGTVDEAISLVLAIH